MGEPETLWGKRNRSNYSDSDVGERETSDATRLTYGSVLSFDATELDPENSLAGFLEYVPMSLRRWACYPMLLGRVRRNFKHVMLVDVKNLMV
ncbi:Transmembrane protein, partial [Quillaja saponaria]